MRRLTIRYDTRPVGILTESENGQLAFQYDVQWREDRHAFPLTLALKLQASPHFGKPVASFFENLLPEGHLRTQLENLAQIPNGDDLAFLERFGEECAGALAISGGHSIEETPKDSGLSEVAVDFDDIEQSIRDGRTVQSVLSHNNELPQFSLSGAQAKFPCIVRDGRIFLPERSQPTTHIVKLPIRAGEKLLSSVANEYLSMHLAKLCGLKVPAVSIIGKNIPLFSIERFDRKVVVNKAYRLHTQDFCQALGRLSREKYERFGGPSFAECYRLVKENSHHAAHDMLALLDWFAFNLAIGNNDSHAKNLSLIFNDGKLALAPFYDLVSTAIYPQFNTEFSFRVGAIASWQKIGLTQINEFARNLALKDTYIAKRWSSLFDAFERARQQVRDEVKNDQSLMPTFRKIETESDKRIKYFRKAWTKASS